MSTTEAAYVALSISFAQEMWIRTHLKDYGFDYNRIPLYYDSQSAIAISCNPVTEYQLADLFTKALPQDKFEYLVRRIGMRCLTPVEMESALRHSGDSSKLNLPDHRSRRRCRNHIPAESDSLPHVHAQATNTYYHHQDLRIKKAKDQTKTKSSANSDIQDLP
ncbi:hypothetical protein Tco_0897751 [Tanacetum coccineum]